LGNSNITARIAARTGYWNQNEKRKKAKANHLESLPRAHEPERAIPGIWCPPSEHCQMDQRACAEFAKPAEHLIASSDPMMSWNLMKPGVLCSRKSTNAGCGL